MHARFDVTFTISRRTPPSWLTQQLKDCSGYKSTKGTKLLKTEVFRSSLRFMYIERNEKSPSHSAQWHVPSVRRGRILQISNMSSVCRLFVCLPTGNCRYLVSDRKKDHSPFSLLALLVPPDFCFLRQPAFLIHSQKGFAQHPTISALQVLF